MGEQHFLINRYSISFIYNFSYLSFEVAAPIFMVSVENWLINLP